MLVEVKPLPVKKWHGKKDRESFAQPKAVEVLYDTQTGKYNTGLTDEEAEKYGQLLGVDLSNTFVHERAHPYWSSKAGWITLPNRTMIFNSDKPEEFVKIKNMKASSKVANSMKEWEDGLYPNATHVIFDEEEDVKDKSTKIAIKNKAIGLLPKMSSEDKSDMVQILSNKSVKGRSDDFINVEIEDIIENKASEFIRVAEMGREEVGIRAKVLQLVAKNIVTKEGTSYYYMSDLIAMSYEDLVSYFKDPNNQKMKVLMLEKLNNTK